MLGSCPKLTLILVLGLTTQGCLCTCLDVEVDFAAACRERGGVVQRYSDGSACVLETGVVATWADEDAG